MQKITLLFLTIIFTSVIVQFSSGRITVIMHGTRIRAPPTQRRQNPATEKPDQQRVQDSNNSNTSRNRRRKEKSKSKVSINTPNVCYLVSGEPNGYPFGSISGLIVLKKNSVVFSLVKGHLNFVAQRKLISFRRVNLSEVTAK